MKSLESKAAQDESITIKAVILFSAHIVSSGELQYYFLVYQADYYREVEFCCLNTIIFAVVALLQAWNLSNPLKNKATDSRPNNENNVLY